MQENRELIKINKHLTNAQIMGAIRYLDPDPRAEETGEDAGRVLGIGITWLIVLTGALAYIGLYVRAL